MIQRIQSIWLFLSAAMGFAALFLPVAHFYQGFQFPIDFESFVNVDNYKELVSGGLLKIAAFLSLIAIFMFRKRKRQITFVRIAQILLFLLILFGIYCFYPFSNITDAKQLLNLTDKYLTKYWAIFIPFIMLVLNRMAIRKIKEDDALVRSMDRLR